MSDEEIPTQESNDGGSNGEKVLVVHHAGPTLRLIREALQGFTDASVDTTPDALYAFEMALQRRYKLFIFSLSLPIINGELLYDLIDKAYRHCHEDAKVTPAIIYIVEEGQAMQNQDLARDARVKGVLTKPLNIDRLLTVVGEVIEN